MAKMCQQNPLLPSRTQDLGNRILEIVDNVIDLRSTWANTEEEPGGYAMNITQRDRDLGTAYAQEPSTYRKELTEVGRGTAMGKLLRRYWHPVGLAADAGDMPRKVRSLGEDLILFRDKGGRPGLLHARCCHRGTTLYYGKVEQDGLRCCYHGWKFDTEGHCLEQPCEPEGGLFKDKVRQPWYPVQERYGMIFAYMGPAEKMPVLPRYDCLESMDEGEFVEADNSSIGGGGPAIIPCNWLQHYENVVDPYHVPILHGSFSGPQFTTMMASMPQVKFETSARGVTVRSIRRQDDGRVFYRVTEAALPTLRVVPNPRVAQFARVESIGWVLPIDDHSFRIYVAGRVKQSGEIGRMRSKFNGKFWWDMTEAEHQAFPGDYEAQVGQGPITLHSEEHFGQSDRGILMIRRLLSDQLETVAAGRDPIGVNFDPDAGPVVFEAGNYIRES
jgi:phenylpropionate dioxygenase-like ring-hydroxylating dioxygenase large terminal subunit